MAHGLQCLRDGRACCSSLPKQFVVLEVSPAADHVVVSTRWFTGLVRVGLNFLLNRTCANVHAHVVVVREHVWRILCSGWATGAHFCQAVLCNMFLVP